MYRDTFQYYREITARRPEAAASCGHAIKAGDRIGWNPRARRTQCAACWDRWVRENQAADFDERTAGQW